LITGYSIFTLGTIILSLHWLSEAMGFATVDAAIKAHCELQRAGSTKFPLHPSAADRARKRNGGLMLFPPLRRWRKVRVSLSPPPFSPP
jgi:hypothetical protein